MRAIRAATKLSITATGMAITRTRRMLVLATTASQWAQSTANGLDLSADHTSTAASFVGGYLDQGTSSTPYIKNFFDFAMVQIDKDTGGAVDADAMTFIYNPNTAKRLAASSELHEFIKGSYWAKEEIIEGLHPNNRYGLPSMLYGYPQIVDRTSYYSTEPGATQASAFAVPDQTMLMVARPGELEGTYGGHSFSTLTLFHHGPDMDIEMHDDLPINRRTIVSVTENVAEVVTSPEAGFLLTLAVSTTG